MQAGTLQLGASERLADDAMVSIASGATLNMNGFSDTVAAVGIAGTLGGPGTLTAATYQLVGATVNANLGTGTIFQTSGTSMLNGSAAALDVRVTGGTLRLGASERLADDAVLSVTSGATLDLGAFDETVGLFGLSGVLDGTGLLTASQYQLAGGTVNANLGAGTLFQLSGVSLLNGTSAAADVQIQGGTLVLGAPERLSNSAMVAVSSGAVLDIGGFNETVQLLGLAGTLNGTGTLTAAQYQLFGGTVNANLGAGTLFQLSGVSLLNGSAGAADVMVQGGTLRLGASNRLLDTAILGIASGATLDLASFNETVQLALIGGRLDGTGALTAGQYQLFDATVNANLGTGVLFQLSGTSLLNGTTATATVLVQGGTLRLGASDRLLDSANVGVSTASTLDIAAFNDRVALLDLAGTLDGTGTLTAGEYQLRGATVNANLGTGVLFQLSGTSLLNGASATSVVQVQAGTLRLGASNRLLDTADVLVTAAGTLDLGGFSDRVGMLDIAGVLAGTGTLSADQYQLRGATVNANLGTGILFQLAGTSLLNGTAGALDVQVLGGTLRLGASDRLADGATVTVSSGATLDIAAFNDTVGLLGLSGTLAGTGTLTAGQYQLSAATVNANLGTGALFQVSGISLLNGTIAAATVAVNGGTLRLGGDERLANTAALIIDAAGTFDLAGRTETVGSLFGGQNGGGTLALGGGRFIVGASNIDSGWGGAITGGGNFDKIGSGRFTLAGNFATTASINVLAGQLAFFGSSAGALRVQGGTLLGSATVGGALTLTSGTIAPEAATGPFGGFQAASLAISGGNFAVDLGGASTGLASDFLSATGTATLTGGTVTATLISVPNQYTFSQRYLVLQSGSLTGTFANGNGFSALAGDPATQWRLRYDLVPNSVVLDVQRDIDFAAGLVGPTPNRLALAAALRGAAGLASDEWATTLNAIAAVPAAQRGATFDSLNGEAIADVSSSTIFVSQQFTELVRQRLENDGFGNAAGNQFGSAGRYGQVARSDIGALASGLKRAGANGEPEQSRRNGLWIQGFAAQQDLDGENGSAAVETSGAGVAGGVHFEFGSFRVGGAVAVSRFDANIDARSSTLEGSLYHGALYASYDDGRTFVDGVATYFGGDVDTSRALMIGGGSAGSAQGETSVEGYSISLSAGRRFDLSERTHLTLGVSGTQTSVTRNGFTEEASGGLGLVAPELQRDLFTATGQARLSHRYNSGGTQVEPYVSVGVNWNSGDLGTLSPLRFSGAPTISGAFTVEGARLAPVMGIAQLGVEIRPSDRFSLGVDLRAATGRNTQEAQAGLHLRVIF